MHKSGNALCHTQQMLSHASTATMNPHNDGVNSVHHPQAPAPPASVAETSIDPVDSSSLHRRRFPIVVPDSPEEKAIVALHERIGHSKGDNIQEFRLYFSKNTSMPMEFGESCIMNGDCDRTIYATVAAICRRMNVKATRANPSAPPFCEHAGYGRTVTPASKKRSSSTKKDTRMSAKRSHKRKISSIPSSREFQQPNNKMAAVVSSVGISSQPPSATTLGNPQNNENNTNGDPDMSVLSSWLSDFHARIARGESPSDDQFARAKDSFEAVHLLTKRMALENDLKAIGRRLNGGDLSSS